MIAPALSWLSRARAARWMRGCKRVGAGLSLDGEPTIEAKGVVEIGERFHFASRPMQSHMIVGPGALLRIGDDVSIAHGAALAAQLRITIGDRTRIAPFVVIMDTDFHVAGAREAKEESTPVEIGRDVRIGSRVTILRGAQVGDGAEIAAGSVVTGAIPAGARASGVPAFAKVAAHVPDGQSGELDVDVAGVVMQAFGLPSRPAPEDGPDRVPGWDSLGTLRLVMALEEAFGVSLDGDVLVKVRSVGDLAAVVERARAPR
jgi:acetyltransferase-like isoleucine patch superfamily enzyme/acyl carrier protein